MVGHVGWNGALTSRSYAGPAAEGWLAVVERAGTAARRPAVEDVGAAEMLVGLEELAVGDQRLALADGDRGRGVLALQGIRGDDGIAPTALVGESVHPGRRLRKRDFCGVR
ncbi:hypothetical protein ACIA5G_49730 [Amycolatopsis sp. NPDC051758]|uniref:hypothetical protein n=1 Tax=Amycolatopsis sp. NPDC051758 TaxID=3363935 RepID=UPI00378DB15B